MDVQYPSNNVPSNLPRVTIYLSEELKADLEELADREHRSVSQQVVYLIDQAVRQAKAEGILPDTARLKNDK